MTYVQWLPIRYKGPRADFLASLNDPQSSLLEIGLDKARTSQHHWW